jgi:long-chain acyl-CoA synthetase
MAWALRVADAWARRVTARRFPGVCLSLQHWLADKLVYGKVRQTFGGSVRILVSGGAALPPDINLLFHGLGLELRQGYGLTETSPVISVNPGYKTLKVGTAGPPVPGVEVKIAEDGEILSRGPHIMKGYWNKPADTAEVIDREGWFYTGDIGHLDEDGHVVITDRKKNLLVLANGKNVAPAAIENKLKSSPLIAEVIALGDGQKSVTALVVPDFEALRALATEKGVRAETNQELVAADEANRAVAAEIKRLSGDFADFEKVRKFRLLDRELTVDGGELTPTLKVKRAVVLEQYADLVRSMAE